MHKKILISCLIFLHPAFGMEKKNTRDITRMIGKKSFESSAIHKKTHSIDHYHTPPTKVIRETEKKYDKYKPERVTRHTTNPEDRFIYDDYTSHRGTPKMLDIYCNYCDAHLIQYQKDGPGRLLRCYKDRMHKFFNADISNSRLTCTQCKKTIGSHMIYQGFGEHRVAFKLINNGCYFYERK